MDNFFILDFPALLALLICSLCCASVGAFMVLRRESLMSDAISHSVLPGIIIAFYITHNRNSPLIFVGAILAAISANYFITNLKQRFSIEQTSSTGIVFSIYFALGIVLLESLSASSIDLDVDCVLHGQLETILWSFPDSISVFSYESLKYIPNQITHGLFALIAVLIFYLLYFNSFIMSSFDRDFALSSGISVSRIEFFYTSLVAIVSVSSFTVVGSILVIALMVCPAASARMYTDKLTNYLFITFIFAICNSLFGYLSAIYLPSFFGFDTALSISGSVVMICGLILFTSILFSPKYGVIGKYLRVQILKDKILEEDIIAYIYRIKEAYGVEREVKLIELESNFSDNKNFKKIISDLIKAKFISVTESSVMLTESGIRRSKDLISKHRLWENFLVKEVGLKEDHVHPNAEIFEHVISEEQHNYLKHHHGSDSLDPHGKPIPK